MNLQSIFGWFFFCGTDIVLLMFILQETDVLMPMLNAFLLKKKKKLNIKKS